MKNISSNGQTTLNGWSDAQEVVKRLQRFGNKFHEIVLLDTRISTFLRSIKATQKKSNEPRYTNKQQHEKMKQFIIQKAKLSEGVTSLTGDEWEDSMRDLMQRVFNEDWDKDFDSLPLSDEKVLEATTAN